MIPRPALIGDWRHWVKYKLAYIQIYSFFAIYRHSRTLLSSCRRSSVSWSIIGGNRLRARSSVRCHTWSPRPHPRVPPVTPALPDRRQWWIFWCGATRYFRLTTPPTHCHASLSPGLQCCPHRRRFRSLWWLCYNPLWENPRINQQYNRNFRRKTAVDLYQKTASWCASCRIGQDDRLR